MKIATRRRTTLAVAVCLLATAVTVLAGATNRGPARTLFTRPDVHVTLAVALQKDNTFIPVPEDPLKPGAVLLWTINSKNQGDREAEQYMATSNIPEGMVLVPGSASAENTAAISYSIDKGKTFVATPVIEVKQTDGSIKLVPAPITAYTQVRYQWSDPLPAGQTYLATYKVRVK